MRIVIILSVVFMFLLVASAAFVMFSGIENENDNQPIDDYANQVCWVNKQAMEDGIKELEEQHGNI